MNAITIRPAGVARFRACGLAFAALGLLRATPVLAAPPNPNQSGGTMEKTGHGFGWANPSNGSYQDEIPIEVPEFDDLEPDFALAYDSTGGNGYVGPGWSLAGLSMIERAGPRRGAPSYGTSDVWLLDGNVLRPCGPEVVGESVSCDHGGTHYPERETFTRIRFVPGPVETDSTWEVTAGDGTRTLYGAVQSVTLGQTRVFRYGVTAVVDTVGDRVDVEWGTSAFDASWLHPRAARYRTGEVEFFWERRPDVESYADGLGLGHVVGRLRTIAVYGRGVDGTRHLQRAYDLTYAVSARTGRSLLTTVREFGRDGILVAGADGEQTIQGGSALPPIQVSYSGSSANDYGSTIGDSGLGAWCPGGSSDGTAGALQFIGDFDGDGKQDLGCRIAGVHYIAHSRSDSTTGAIAFVQRPPQLNGFCNGPQDREQTGDFDADGRTDLVCRTASGVSVATSTGDGFASPVLWSGPWCTEQDSRPFGGDFDGDGVADVACRARTGVSVRLSTRSAFATPELWSTDWCAEPQYAYSGDFDGDGRTDIACRTDGGNHRLQLSTGTAFSTAVTWLAGWCTLGNGVGMSTDGTPVEYLYSGDFNGDGKEDLGCRSGGRQHVALSTGSSFAPQGIWDQAAGFCPDGAAGGHTYYDAQGRPIETYYAFQYPADFDADGRTDLACRAGLQVFVALSTGRGFASTINLPSGCLDGTESGTGGSPLMLVGDFDGDGRTDTVCRQADGRQTVSLTSHMIPDLLVRITNGYGGSIEPRYRVAASWPDTRGMRSMTVESIDLSDGRSTVAQTRFAYSGGRYDREHKASLGFATVKTMSPPVGSESAGPYSETSFSQSYASRGLPLRSEVRSGAGVLMAKEVNDYGVHDRPPYRAQAIAKWSYEIFDESHGVETCDATTTAYDAFGNVVRQTDLGDCTVDGDELTTTTTYVPNVSNFLVTLPAVETVHMGVGTGGELIEETRTYYDHATDHLAPAEVGLPTRAEVRIDPERLAATDTEFDTHGNPVRTTDPLGAVTATAYDALDRVVTVTDALGHSEYTTWDPACGNVASVTDANGAVSATTYDAFCRPTLLRLPAEGFVRTTYVNTGNPFAQYVQTDTPAANGVDGSFWTREYRDGLGRVYRTERRGPTADATINTETVFDARGRITKTSAPYFWDGWSSPVSRTWIYTLYAPNDEPTDTLYADGSRERVVRWLRDTQTTDPEGHQTMARKDGLGRVVLRGDQVDRNEVGESPSPRWLYTSYEYDGRGGLVRVTDPNGNVTTYGRDWEGHVLRTVDPDLGTRSFAYDRKGRLVAEVDALGQTTTVQYDALDRPVERTIGSGVKAIIHRFVYDDVSNGGAAIGRLTASSYAPANEEHWHYDLAGRADRYERIIDGVSFALTYAFDAAGNRIQTRYPDGSYDTADAAHLRTYDGAGRLLSIPGVIDTLEWDADGNLVERINANGTVSAYTYDPVRGWLTNVLTTKGETVLQNDAYTHDHDGLVRQVDDLGVSPAAQPGPTRSWWYDYNALHELLVAENDSEPERNDAFAYDDLGNIAWTTANGLYTTNASGANSVRPHAVTQVGHKKFRYDANGNMTRSRAGTVRYDGTRMPVKIRSTVFAYDADGERYKKGKRTRPTKFVTNDYEIAPDGTVTRYVKLDDDDSDGFSLVARVTSSGPESQTYTLHPNSQGSITLVTDQRGNVVLRREFGPFGTIQWASSNFKEARGYTGHRHDDETALLYMRARYYDAGVARFLQADEVLDGHGVLGLNRYAYVSNDPINEIDPTGHCGGVCLFLLRTAVSVGIKLVVDAVGREHDGETLREFMESYAAKKTDASIGVNLKFRAKTGLQMMHFIGDELQGTVKFRKNGGKIDYAFWSQHQIYKDVKKKMDGRAPVCFSSQTPDCGKERANRKKEWRQYNRAGAQKFALAIRTQLRTLQNRQFSKQGAAMTSAKVLRAAKRAVKYADGSHDHKLKRQARSQLKRARAAYERYH